MVPSMISVGREEFAQHLFDHGGLGPQAAYAEPPGRQEWRQGPDT